MSFLRKETAVLVKLELKIEMEYVPWSLWLASNVLERCYLRCLRWALGRGRGRGRGSRSRSR